MFPAWVCRERNVGMVFKAQRPVAPGMGEPRQAMGALGAKADVWPRDRAVHTRGGFNGCPRSPDATATPLAIKPDWKGLHRKNMCFTSADRPGRSDPSPEEQAGLQREAGVTWQKSRAACTFYAPTSELKTQSGHLDHSPWRAALMGLLQATARASQKVHGAA